MVSVGIVAYRLVFSPCFLFASVLLAVGGLVGDRWTGVRVQKLAQILGPSTRRGLWKFWAS